MCDLGVTIEGTDLEARIAQLNTEMDARGLTFRPYYWLSDEWFTPDGVPGIAIPFYLAHPRLAKLEFAQMLEVEGGDPEECMRILRHEVGHAIDNAFALRRRPRRRRLFGHPGIEYPEYYTPKPYSKSYVQHLDHWYAQSHPDEDFAETFAVWLSPASEWRQRYAGWPALRKLEYMDGLMTSIGHKAAPVDNPVEIEPLSQIRTTLRLLAEYRLPRLVSTNVDYGTVNGIVAGPLNPIVVDTRTAPRRHPVRLDGGIKAVWEG